MWITGLPASGKSTIARALIEALAARDVDCARLESDALREVLSGLDYSASGRDTFYRALGWTAALLTEHGVPVVIDATASRRAYRDQARRAIGKFVEVHVTTPLAVCMQRDPKGIYRSAGQTASNAVPGLGAEYELPEHPDVAVPGVGAASGEAVDQILSVLESRGWIPR